MEAGFRSASALLPRVLPELGFGVLQVEAGLTAWRHQFRHENPRLDVAGDRPAGDAELVGQLTRREQLRTGHGEIVALIG